MVKSCLKEGAPSRLPQGISPGNSPRLVKFGQIHFRDFPMIMGDNPSCLAGVPITLGWKHTHEYDYDLDEYEQAYTFRRSKNFCPKLDVQRRAQILLGSGYSMVEIVERTMEVLEAQRNRSDSIKNRKWDGFSHFLEITRRKFKKSSSGRSSLKVAASNAKSEQPGSSPSPMEATSETESAAPRRMFRRGSLSDSFSSDKQPPRRMFRRGSLSESATSDKPHDLGEKILRNDRTGLFQRLGTKSRRRTSLNFTPQPNFQSAISA